MDGGQWPVALYRRLSPRISLNRSPWDSAGEVWTDQCNFHAMKINHVEKESIAASIGLKPGDRLESIDGSRVKDIIDYRFKVTDANILLRVRQGG